MNILIAKKISFDKITIHCSDYEFSFKGFIQKQIDLLRDKKVLESEKKGHRIRDGLNYFLQGYTENQNTLLLKFGTVKFRNISMGNFLPESLKKNIQNNQPKGVFVAGIIRTSNNYFLFPKRSGRDVTKVISGQISTFGGVLQPDECTINNFHDIRVHMHNELEEELGIQAEHITTGEFIGLTISKALNRGIIFYINLNINHHTVLEMFNKRNDGEMSEILFVHSDQVHEFLTNEGFDAQGNYSENLGLYRDILIKTHII